MQQDEPLNDLAEYPTLETSASFGELLRRRREAAGLGPVEIARRSGLTRGTVTNIEKGKTLPAPETIRRLMKIKELRLEEEATAANWGEWTPEATYAPSYSPLSLGIEMAAACNAPGGSLDQAFLYLDLQGANDWLRYFNDAQVVSNFRLKLPLEEVSKRILAGGTLSEGLDVMGLGVGDGQSETRLAKILSSELPSGSNMRFYIMDISHALLHAAFRHATNSLNSLSVLVLPVHGDFHGLTRYPVIAYRAPNDHRRRIWTLLGGTVGNLRDEVHFFRDLASISRPGDWALIDLQLVQAPADQLKEVRAKDSALNNPMPALWETWISGPLRRHCHGLASIKMRADVTNRCIIPGSYELHFMADVVLYDGTKRSYLAHRVKRYDATEFAAALDETGWAKVLSIPYGPQPARCAAVLLRRV